MSCKTVLIIDDDEGIRETLADILEVRGYQPLLASDGQAGLDLLRAATDLPSVILLDMMMPGMNGWKFLEEQRQDLRLAQIPVIVCSAFPESAKTVRPKAILPKPIQLNSLLGAVNAFCS